MDDRLKRHLTYRERVHTFRILRNASKLHIKFKWLMVESYGVSIR